VAVVQGSPGRQPTGSSVGSEDHDAHVSLRTNAVLVALAVSNGQSQRQLSARLGLHRNVMVSLIDTLDEQGLVKRMPHPDDRRAFAVTLTDKARTCCLRSKRSRMRWKTS
jgi:DNA-binding MarR family transcriptional regulator